jgi:hypothetical protein
MARLIQRSTQFALLLALAEEDGSFMSAMEMTEYGKAESHDAGFPHSRGLDDEIYVVSCPPNPNHGHRKGLVTGCLRSIA